MSLANEWHVERLSRRERSLNLYLPDKIDQRSFVLIPNRTQFFPRRKFPTAEFKRQFKAVARQVIEILHATAHGIPNDRITDNVQQPIGMAMLPSCTVGDTILKRIGRAVLARQGHFGMALGVGLRQLPTNECAVSVAEEERIT